MTLIADGGSTKCDWILLQPNGEIALKSRTQGLNPTVISPEELLVRIRENKELIGWSDQIRNIDFYGAGCGTKTPNGILTDVLRSVFPQANVTVKEDMAAAVYAVTTEAGIVCILGTGSNSCFFDGNEIHQGIPSLGYTLMDEASGNYYGKQLLRDYFYKSMPETLAKEFESRYELDPDVIKLNLYKRPNPNTYLASFAEFIFTSEDSEGYFKAMISEGIRRFVEHQVLCYKEAQQVPIHFVGSIAHFSEAIIRDTLKQYQLTLGTIIQRPIDGLIDYYRNHQLNERTSNEAPYKK